MPLASTARKGGGPQSSSSAATLAGLEGEDPPRLWGDEKVRAWLESRGIPAEILRAFEDNLVNGLLCEDLSDADLEGMGVTNPLHRKRVLLELARLFGRQSPKASPRSPKAKRKAPQENQQVSACELGSTTDSIDQTDPESPSKASKTSAADGIHAKPQADTHPPSTGGTKSEKYTSNDAEGRPGPGPPPKTRAQPIEREIQILLDKSPRREGEDDEGEDKINILLEQQGEIHENDEAGDLKIIVGRTGAATTKEETDGSPSNVALNSTSSTSILPDSERAELFREIRRLQLDLDLQKQSFQHLESLTKVRQDDLVAQNDQLSQDLKYQEQLQQMTESLVRQDEAQAEKERATGEARAAALVEREAQAYSKLMEAMSDTPREDLNAAGDIQSAFELERQCLRKELAGLEQQTQEQSDKLRKASARSVQQRLTYEDKTKKLQATLNAKTAELEDIRAQIRNKDPARELTQLEETYKEEAQELKAKFKTVLQSTSEALMHRDGQAENRSGMEELQMFITQQVAHLEGDSTVWALSATTAASWSNHERQHLLTELPRWQNRVEELEKAMVSTVDHLTKVQAACDAQLHAQPQNDPGAQSALQRWGTERQRLLDELATCQGRAQTLEARQRDLIMTVVEMQGVGPDSLPLQDSKELPGDAPFSRGDSAEALGAMLPGQTPQEALASAKGRVGQLERRQETLQSTLYAVTSALQNRDAMEISWQQERAELLEQIDDLRQYAEQIPRFSEELNSQQMTIAVQ